VTRDGRSFRRSLEHHDLVAYLERQIQAFFPDGKPLILNEVVAEAVDRCRYCFAHLRNPSFGDVDTIVFDHLHGDQYTMFLYYASNSAFRAGEIGLAKKLFLLNKSLSGFFCLYDTVLPPIMFLNHALGTVIGRGTYGNYLLVTQNVTFGKDKEIAPVIGEGVIVFGGALIAGATHIGDRTVVAPHASIINAAVPAGSIVAGKSPNLTIRPRRRLLSEEFFVF